jgi:hypothetical protein
MKDGRMLSEKVIKFENAIKTAFPEAMVDVPEELVQIMTNSPEDRHVLATAVFDGAEIIVTDNLKDFQPKDITIWDKKAMSADDFLTYLYEISPNQMIEAIQRQANAKRNPTTSSELLDILDKTLKRNRTTSNFANNVRYHEKKWVIAKAIEKVLQLYGRKSSNFRKYLEGDRYRIWIDKHSIGITSKICNSDILFISGSRASSILQEKDIVVFDGFVKEVESLLSN